MNNNKMRVPPYSVEAEQSVIGACLIDGEMAKRIVHILQPEDFYRDEHEKIFQAIRECVQKKVPVDIISVGNELTKVKELSFVGGIPYIARLADSVPNSANGIYYANIVRDKAERRRLIKTGGQISELGWDNSDIDILAHRAKDMIHIGKNIKIKNLQENLMDILQKISQAPPDIEIPFPSFKRFVSFKRGDLVLIEGDKKNGKTTFAMNMILRLLQNNKVAIATYEIDAETVYIPLLARAYEQKETFTKDEVMQQVTKFTEVLGDKLYIIPAKDTYMEDFATSIIDFVKDKQLDFVFVDYDQLVKSKNTFPTEERRVSAISRTMKALATEANCVTVLLSQVNKEGEARWSREKENDASVVIRLEKDPVLDEISVWVPLNRYNKAFRKEEASRMTVDWTLRTIEDPLD